MADDMVVTQHQVEVEVDGLPTGTAKHRLLRYNSPLAQVFLIGLVCFCCPGMFNALSGLGGGGQLDHTTIDKANTALYACFAVFGVVGSAAHNLFGPRNTLLLGALAYPLYAASFLYYNHHHTDTIPVIAGTLLGAGAGLLWAAQGAIVTSYPPPNRRGTYISIFWCLYNLGGVFGGLFPFSFNYHRGSRKAASVNDATYIAFMAFMLLGATLALLILPPDKIIRDDGSKATRFAYSSVAKEGTEMLKLFTNWKMLLVLPAAWTSNFFYTYQFNNVNVVLFTLRTQGLNNVFYWCARMVGSASIGYLLDFGFATSRRKRGLIGVTIVAVLGTAIWGGGLPNQLRYKDGQWQEELIDFKDGRRYAGPFLLFLSYGILDAMFQMLEFEIYLEARGLDAGPRLVQRLFGFGDHRSADIVARVAEEELAHVSVGLYWFLKVCQMMGREPGDTFKDLIKGYGVVLKGPFNYPARDEAGIPREWYDEKFKQEAAQKLSEVHDRLACIVEMEKENASLNG